MLAEAALGSFARCNLGAAEPAPCRRILENPSIQRELRDQFRATVRDGKERGGLFCRRRDGTLTYQGGCVGNTCSVNINAQPECRPPRGSRVGSYHTHPVPALPELSPADWLFALGNRDQTTCVGGTEDDQPTVNCWALRYGKTGFRKWASRMDGIARNARLAQAMRAWPPYNHWMGRLENHIFGSGFVFEPTHEDEASCYRIFRGRKPSGRKTPKRGKGGRLQGSGNP